MSELDYSPEVAIPTFVGSIVSFTATSCILLSYVRYHAERKSFRHALVLNLAIADCINSLNNTISGIYTIVKRRSVGRGPACIANGWIGQWSVQAVDFSILFIAIVTLLTVTRRTYMPNISLPQKIGLCALVWVIPTITGWFPLCVECTSRHAHTIQASTAAGLNAYTPVSGNWCWMTAARTDLRYALGHGWRFTIILSTIAIYIFIACYMKHHFSQLNGRRCGTGSYGSSALNRRNGTTRSNAPPLELTESQTELSQAQAEFDGQMRSGKVVEEMVEDLNRSDTSASASFSSMEKPRAALNAFSACAPSNPHNPLADEDKPLPPRPLQPRLQPSSNQFRPTKPNTPKKTRLVEKEIQRMLLLNGYPIAYVILWMPGILNRIMEAASHPSEVLGILQASTQFIGLANAITYGVNEHLRRSVKEDLRNWIGERKQKLAGGDTV